MFQSIKCFQPAVEVLAVEVKENPRFLIQQTRKTEGCKKHVVTIGRIPVLSFEHETYQGVEVGMADENYYQTNNRAKQFIGHINPCVRNVFISVKFVSMFSIYALTSFKCGIK